MTYSNGPNLLIPYILPSLTKQSELLCHFCVYFTASPASWYFWTGLQTGMTVLFVWSVCLSLSSWLLQRSTNTDNAKQYCTVTFLPTNTTWIIHTYALYTYTHTHTHAHMHARTHTHTHYTRHTHTLHHTHTHKMNHIYINMINNQHHTYTDIGRAQQQRPDSPTVTITRHASKYKVHKIQD